MSRRNLLGAVTAATMLAALLAVAGTAVAQQRAFVLDHGHRTSVTDIAVLPDGRVVLLESTGRIVELDRLGRRRPLAKVPSFYETDLDAAADGTLVVAADDRVYRITLDGTMTPLTPAVDHPDRDDAVRHVAAAADGSVVYSTSTRLFRRSPDGTTTRLAGPGAGYPKPGPATESPIGLVDAVTATSDGSVLFAEFDGDGIWEITPAGEMRRFVAQRFRDVISLDEDPERGVVVSTFTGVHSISGGVVRQILDAHDGYREDALPFASGAPVGESRMSRPGNIAFGPDGHTLLTVGGSLVLLTDGAGRSDRLAVALLEATLSSAPARRVVIAATRPARVIVEARAAGRRVLRQTAEVGPGVNEVALEQRLPAGLVELTVRATADDAGVTGHGLTVLGTRTVPLDVAREALHPYLLSTIPGKVHVFRPRCGRRAATAIVCRVRLSRPSGESRRTYSVTRRADGWLWATGGGRSGRLVLPTPRPG